MREHSFIVVGNVSSSGLAKTKMAKSVLDAKRVRVAGLALTVGFA